MEASAIAAALAASTVAADRVRVSTVDCGTQYSPADGQCLDQFTFRGPDQELVEVPPESVARLPRVVDGQVLPEYSPPRQPRRVQQHRATRYNASRRTPQEQSTTSPATVVVPTRGADRKDCSRCCLRCVVIVTSLRWVLISLALFGVGCIVTGIVLGALNVTTNSNYIMMALIFIGIGVVIILVVGVCWRCAPRGQEPCHRLCHLTHVSEELLNEANRDPRSSRLFHHGRNQWYGGVLYPEFQYCSPPPSYTRSMQDYMQQQLRPTPRNTGSSNSLDNLSLPASTPPTYRSRISAIDRPPLPGLRNNSLPPPAYPRTVDISTNPLGYPPTIENSGTPAYHPTIDNSDALAYRPIVEDSSTIAYCPTIENSCTQAYPPIFEDSGTLAYPPIEEKSGTLAYHPTIENSSTLAYPPTIENSSTLAYRPTIENSGTIAYRPTIENSSTIAYRPTIENSGTIAYCPTIENSGTKAYPQIVEDSGTLAYPPIVENSGTLSYPLTIENSGTQAYPPIEENSGTLAYHPTIENSGTQAYPPIVENTSTLAYPPIEENSGTLAYHPTIEDTGTLASPRIDDTLESLNSQSPTNYPPAFGSPLESYVTMGQHHGVEVDPEVCGTGFEVSVQAEVESLNLTPSIVRTDCRDNEPLACDPCSLTTRLPCDSSTDNSLTSD